MDSGQIGLNSPCEAGTHASVCYPGQGDVAGLWFPCVGLKLLLSFTCLRTWPIAYQVPYPCEVSLMGIEYS